MSRTVKAPYTGSKRFSVHCRCHGGCSYCESSRLRYKRIGEDLLKQGLSDAELPSRRNVRLRIVRLNLDNIQPLERIGKGSPKRVDIDLTKAFRKIKLCLNAGLV